MDVQVEKTGPYLRKVSITIPATDVDKAFNSVHREIAKSVTIPGFRPGKAPKNVVNAHHGPRIRGEVEERLVSESLAKALQENDVNVIAPPKVETDDLAKGIDFSYTATVEVRPEIELKKYEGLKAPRLEAKIDPKDVEAEITKLRESAVQFVPVLLRDEVEKTDFVLVDYQGFVNDEPIEGAKAENAIIDVRSDDYLPGLAEALIGAKVPGKFDVPITFPADYGVEKLRGVDAKFHVELKEIKKKELPELDDEFAQDLGEESLESLTTKVTEAIGENKNREVEKAQRVALLKSLVEANPIEVPPSMVADQADRMIADATARVQMMMGEQFPVDQLDLESLRRDNLDAARFQVQSGLLLLEVAKAADLKVDEEEIEAEIAKMAESAGEQGERLRTMYREPEQRKQLEYKLLEDKTVRLMLDSAELVDGPPPDESAEASAEGEGTAAGDAASDKNAEAEAEGSESENQAESEAADAAETQTDTEAGR